MRTELEPAPTRQGSRSRLQRRPRVDRTPATWELVAPRCSVNPACQATRHARRARARTHRGPTRRRPPTAGNLNRSRHRPRPRDQSGAVRQELMTRTTAGREDTNPSRQRGLLGFSGRLSHSPRGLRLCVSSRAPSRAGRSPYNSEPSIEAPDSTTTSRRIFVETPSNHGQSRIPPGGQHAPTPSARSRCLTRQGVKPGPHVVIPAHPRKWGPTLVSVPNPPFLCLRSHEIPADHAFLGCRGYGV